MPKREDNPSGPSAALMIVTGLTKNEVEANGNRSTPPDQCYLCKRKTGSKSIIMVKKSDEEDYAVIDNELQSGYIERERSGGKFVYQVCFECIILFDLEQAGSR